MPTHLPQNQFITNSAPARTSPGVDDAGASPPPPLRDASAALSTNPVMPTTGPAVAFSDPSGSDATAALIPASTGGPQEAPAGSAPNTVTLAGALGDKLSFQELLDFITDERIVLFDPFIEHPLFVIEDGYLQRTEA